MDTYAFSFLGGVLRFFSHEVILKSNGFVHQKYLTEFFFVVSDILAVLLYNNIDEFTFCLLFR